jgi:hypothetical protein
MRKFSMLLSVFWVWMVGFSPLLHAGSELTHEPENHDLYRDFSGTGHDHKGVDEWLSVQGSAPPEWDPARKEATAVKQWSFTLSEVENQLKNSASLNVTQLWNMLGIVPHPHIIDDREMYLFGFHPREATPAIVEKGTWEYTAISPQIPGIEDKSISEAVKIIQIRDNRWNHQFLIFARENAELIYKDHIDLVSQQGIHPKIRFLKLSDEFTVFTLLSLDRCGQLPRTEMITVYVYFGEDIIPVLTILKSGYVYGGESSCDREYEICIDGVKYREPDTVVVKYHINYYGIHSGYSYDEKYVEEPKKILLNSVRKTARFVWDKSRQRYVFDEESSTLADEDIEVIMCTE